MGLIPSGRSRVALAQRGRAVGLGGILAAFEDLGEGNLAYAVRCVRRRLTERLRQAPEIR